MTLEPLWPRRTQRLLLRPPTHDDLDQLLRWRSHPDVTRWLLRTEIEADSYRRAWLADAEDPLDHSAVALLGSTVVGTATLGVTDSMGQGARSTDVPWSGSEASIGYLLDPAVHGRGLGTEIVAAQLSLAFDDLGLHRVTASCFAANLPSWRVMEKCGMRREQHGVEDSWHADLGWVDGYTYAMIRSEWAGSAGQRLVSAWTTADASDSR